MSGMFLFLYFITIILLLPSIRREHAAMLIPGAPLPAWPGPTRLLSIWLVPRAIKNAAYVHLESQGPKEPPSPGCLCPHIKITVRVTAPCPNSM